MEQLKKGTKAPLFSAVNQAGKIVNLQDFIGNMLILYFYPKDDTPGCTAEACNLRDNYNHWIEKGYKIIGISPDNEKSHKKFKEKYNLPFDLLSDPDHQILETYGAWGIKQMYGKSYEGVLRTTYIIDKEGYIEQVFTKVDTKNHTEQIIQELKL